MCWEDRDPPQHLTLSMYPPPPSPYPDRRTLFPHGCTRAYHSYGSGSPPLGMHPHGHPVVFSPPLTGWGNCGIPAYTREKCKEQLDQGNDAVLSCNFWWLNTEYELQPNLPRHEVNIVNLQETFFATPKPYPQEGVVVILDADSELLPDQLKGQLKAVCGPPMRDAFRKAVGECVLAGAGNGMLDQWLKYMLSVPMRFKRAPALSPDKPLIGSLFKDMVQAREHIGIKWENTRCSNFMRSYEIIDFISQMTKGNQTKMGNKEVAEFYKSIQFAKGSEPVTATAVEVSKMLHSNVLVHVEIRDICFDFDRLGVLNPLDSLYKYREIAVGCDKNAEKMLWVFTLIWDWWHRCDGKHPISIGKLKGLSGHIVLFTQPTPTNLRMCWAIARPPPHPTPVGCRSCIRCISRKIFRVVEHAYMT